MLREYPFVCTPTSEEAQVRSINRRNYKISYAKKNVSLCDSLLRLLRDCGYQVTTLEEKPVDFIDSYGEIVAEKPRSEENNLG